MRCSAPPAIDESPSTLSYRANTASTTSSSNTEIEPAKPQFMVCCTWSMISWATMISLRPPSSAGTIKKPTAVTNTMMAPAATPGIESGK
ncbi:hypothetical protein D3C72_1628610 [compost metagenome]